MPEGFIEVKGYPQGPPNSYHTGYLDVGHPQGSPSSYHTGYLGVVGSSQHEGAEIMQTMIISSKPHHDCLHELWAPDPGLELSC